MKKMLQDYLNKDNREEKLRSEKKNLMDNLIYRKNNFDSVFVSLIKFKNKVKEQVGKEGNEEEFEQEEEEEEDDKNLVKIKSGEYVVKEQKEQQLRSHKVNDNKEKEKEKEINKEKEIKKEIKDCTNIKTTIKDNYTYTEKTDDNVYNNHKMVEIKYTNKKKY